MPEDDVVMPDAGDALERLPDDPTVAREELPLVVERFGAPPLVITVPSWSYGGVLEHGTVRTSIGEAFRAAGTTLVEPWHQRDRRALLRFAEDRRARADVAGDVDEAAQLSAEAARSIEHAELLAAFERGVDGRPQPTRPNHPPVTLR